MPFTTRYQFIMKYDIDNSAHFVVFAYDIYNQSILQKMVYHRAHHIPDNGYLQYGLS